MKRVALVGLILLGACTHMPREVRVPVAVPCVAAADIPPEVPPTGALPEDARTAADLLGAKVLELRGTDRELRALLRGCTETTEQPESGL